MFGKKKADEIRAFLGNGSSFQGKLAFHGSIRVDGNVSGNITGDGLLVIGEGARIEADIEAPSVRIGGTVLGSIEARESIHITPTGSLRGDIRTAVFVCEEGGFFTGHCQMQQAGDSLPDDG
ncbi:MAG TPA: polymer-forming cytoskeletal protein [Syntrophales bacterium]|jgi:cytoskeletal protein CcmA (bactofilin family)|nr:polymer-forming cytoskeletal protein [Syntrophales bacterium]